MHADLDTGDYRPKKRPQTTTFAANKTIVNEPAARAAVTEVTAE